ncbi:sporulation integral membrane protein YlbJ [Paenibacillus turicensis]|uniref:Sporulation integral membrane protein YlbJ n=1 Tax=Paenibacillus turicensis TaxID=160487 RepID=A0ABS4FXK0_9BACL|nr:nucleoside recognition domain-containing protein [Paenibacillus turicensis]MBP1907306.1 sporulation integral membrane protein YlbJ [Paenibacillus turicensis]
MKQKWSTLLLATGAILLVFSIIYSPSAAFKASGEGLAIWWRIIFPGLLPFLVLSHILIASGFVHGIGKLVEPYTKRWLGLPGIASFIIPLGMTAGFPAGADAASKLQRQGQITSTDAEKIASYSHFCSPMLIIIVIGAGFAKQPWLGLFLLGIHWIAGLLSGMSTNALLRTKQVEQDKAVVQSNIKASHKKQPSRIRLAIRSMEEAHQADGRSFGKLLGDAVGTSVQTLMMIGGYILIFSVIIYVLTDTLKQLVPSPMIASLLEVHLGSFSIVTQSISLYHKSIWLSALLGFSGLCAYLQVQALLKSTGTIGKFFFVHRLLHACYGLVLTILLWRPITSIVPGAISAYSYQIDEATITSYLGIPLPAISQLIPILHWQLILFTAIIALILLYSLLRKPQSSIK